MLEYETLIEFARLQDAEAIGLMSRNDVERGLGWQYTPDRVARIIRDSSKNVVVARVESQLAGFGIMTYYESRANLDLLAVKEKFRRRRIGTRIVQWLQEVALTAGAFNVYVQVRSRNTGAVKFYENLDFIVVDEMQGYYKGVETAVIMAKSLTRIFHPIA